MSYPKKQQLTFHILGETNFNSKEELRSEGNSNLNHHKNNMKSQRNKIKTPLLTTTAPSNNLQNRNPTPKKKS